MHRIYNKIFFNSIDKENTLNIKREAAIGWTSQLQTLEIVLEFLFDELTLLQR
jgi:hypothetical protein